MNIYREVVSFINVYKPGETFTTKDFHEYMAEIGYKDSYQPHYRINTYRTYLRSAGFVTNIKRGVWRVDYYIPHSMSLHVLESARGYGCSKSAMLSAQEEIKAYLSNFNPPTPVPVRTWKVGDKFKTSSRDSTEFTIARIDANNQVVITWPPDRLRAENATTYSITSVDSNFAKRIWLPIKKTNIQEKSLNCQPNSLHLLKQTNMSTKQTELPVSPAFIVKAHGLACATWKTQLEQMYPQVLKPKTVTFKIGDKVKFQGIMDHYILAYTGDYTMILINTSEGTRWTNPVKVVNISAVSLEEMQSLCGTESISSVLVNGIKVKNQYPLTSDEKTLTASVATIKSAYDATVDTKIRSIIKDYFPEVFAPQYVKLLSTTDDKSITFSTSHTNIDGVDFILGRGLAPKGLSDSCIGVDSSKVDVELMSEGGKTWIAFKKK